MSNIIIPAPAASGFKVYSAAYPAATLTTSPGAATNVPGLSVVVALSQASNGIKIHASLGFEQVTTGNHVYMSILVDGVVVAKASQYFAFVAGSGFQVARTLVVTGLAAGNRTITVQWSSDSAGFAKIDSSIWGGFGTLIAQEVLV